MSHIFSHFQELLFFMSHPIVFSLIRITKDHSIFNFSGKVFSLPIGLKTTYQRNFLQNSVLSRGRDDPPFGSHRKPPHTHSAPGSCPGPLRCPRHRHQCLLLAEERNIWYLSTSDTSTASDSLIHKPTIKNNTLPEWRFLIFDKAISKFKWKKA